MPNYTILVIHHGALGDIVATFPTLLKLKKKYGRIEMLCESRIGHLARGLDVVDHHFPNEAAAFATLYSSSVNPAVKTILLEYDKIVLFSRSRDLRNRLLSMTGKPVCGIEPKPHMDQNVHVTEHAFSNLVRCGFLEKTDVNTGAMSSSDVHPDRRDPNFDRSRILIHPGSGSRKKCWPVSNFVRIARLLRQLRLRLYLDHFREPDRVTVSLNNQKLDTTSDHPQWLVGDVPPRVMTKGPNELAIRFERGQSASWSLALRSVELSVRYGS